jgi:hypothetical protein
VEESLTQKKAEYLDLARQAFGTQLFTRAQLTERLNQQRTRPIDDRTVQRILKAWQKEKIVYKLGNSSSTQYTFARERANREVSAGAKRFEQFRAKSQWKPTDRGDTPVFGHPTKKQNNRCYPYQVSSSSAFQSPDYINFFKTTKNETFSDEIARRELNRAIEKKRLSKVGSNNARTYAIIEGEEPGYSNYVVPLDTSAFSRSH